MATGDVDMAWLAQSNVETRNAEVFALGKRVRVPILGGCWLAQGRLAIDHTWRTRGSAA
jgi:hypothetical protein